jgi:hypothetical protein
MPDTSNDSRPQDSSIHPIFGNHVMATCHRDKFQASIDIAAITSNWDRKRREPVKQQYFSAFTVSERNRLGRLHSWLARYEMTGVPEHVPVCEMSLDLLKRASRFFDSL